MLSGKVEKRIASSVYITLAPPRRDTVIKGDVKPEVHQPSSEHPKEAAKSDGTHPPQVLPPCSLLVSGFSSFPRPVLTDVPTGPDPESPPPSPPPYLLPGELNAPLWETLCPDLQKLHVSSPASQQVLMEGWRRRPALQSGFISVVPTWVPPAPVICAFCHKAIVPRAPTIEAMNKQYHVDCFTCRTCHGPLAGQRYYQKEGRPMCSSCYKETLETCAKCQGLILEHIIRALGNGYHPECFMCSVCGRSIGDESFAVNDQNEVHCVDDFYRKYASICSVCETPIIPLEGKDAYRIECMGRSFHESCYRCEKCRIPLSTEPAENGCYPLDSHVLCKPCHIKQKNESFC
uniref:Filamin binding LIM protein 1 n=1 Tax=Chelydra serpentina TaxID=8475 RepID=A0A8C3SSH1_CHESE